MHSDPEAIRKSVRTYLMIGAALFVFTVITVMVNQVHLAVPLAITVALIIATTKGSMVAAVFMHLSHEKKWIYGALILTVIGFLILMAVPSFTVMDSIGTPIHVESPASAEHGSGH
jgi:caa(3)-type oxidase subunit IV